MKPNLLRIKQNSSASTSSKSLTQLSEDGGCPSGTVPIKRITKDDLIRHRRMPPPENVPFDDQFVARFAKSINWGGVAYSPTTDVAEPPMGSSFFPIENSGYDAYCKKIAILDVKGKTIAVDKTITHIDNPNLYKVLFKPLWIGSKSSFYVFYGGPGESAQV
ncbi:hypothetical protein MTR67_037248 [Solanum verrucosum]|uniref:Neprosin PEP catalytic domain-containing protein n=1 Tax=Solanum verrucosum TaxID=315347 RepID=A0AAF0ZNA1_SOLVR|nr:hypothetical protein MTR67_037248 [Solanum verrucosum]